MRGIFSAHFFCQYQFRKLFRQGAAMLAAALNSQKAINQFLKRANGEVVETLSGFGCFIHKSGERVKTRTELRQSL